MKIKIFLIMILLYVKPIFSEEQWIENDTNKTLKVEFIIDWFFGTKTDSCNDLLYPSGSHGHLSCNTQRGACIRGIRILDLDGNTVLEKRYPGGGLCSAAKTFAYKENEKTNEKDITQRRRGKCTNNGCPIEEKSIDKIWFPATDI